MLVYAPCNFDLPAPDLDPAQGLCHLRFATRLYLVSAELLVVHVPERDFLSICIRGVCAFWIYEVFGVSGTL